MAEENKVDVDNQGQQNQTEKLELTPIEQQAMDEGWVPKEQWEGDPDKWRPAREFIDRGELFKKIEDQNRTVKQLKMALDDLKGHHAKVRETEYARALTALKQQKKTALQEGDADRVVDIDDQIELVRDEQLRLKQQTMQEQVDASPAPEFVEWVNRNKWYDTDDGMKGYADALGRRLAAAGKNPTAVLAEVEKQVRAEFPHKFRNVNRDRPGAVEGSSTKGGKGDESFALSDDERRVMQRFVRTGVMSEKEYITELKRVRGA